jgi:putative ABC transport system permease protein
VLSKGVLLAIIGILLGLAGTAGLWHVLGVIIPGLQGQDMMSLALIAVILLAVALAACLLPARRATKVDPLTALKHE